MAGRRPSSLLVAAALLMSIVPSNAGVVRQAQPRTASVSDVDGVYTSIYKFDADLCPDSIAIEGTVSTMGDLGQTPVVNIKEDNVQCEGETMFTIPESLAANDTELVNNGFADVPRRLITNGAAQAVVRGRFDIADTLVGFDNATRTCGSRSYDLNTFWFFIREDGAQTITITSQEKGAEETVIPSGEKAIFVTTPGRTLCILSAAIPATEAPPTVAVSEAPATTVTLPPEEQTTASTSTNASTTTESGASPSPSATTSSSPSPSPSDSTTENDGDGSVCFPSGSSVQLVDGSRRLIQDLHVGDVVRTGPGENDFSPVIMFTHHIQDVRTRFITLHTSTGHAISLTPSHYIHVSKFGRMVAARDVEVGDILILARVGDGGESTQVVRKEYSVRPGLYNPQTSDGNIVVDGIVASAYTTAVHPVLAHYSLLMPVRWIHALGVGKGWREQFFAQGSDLVARVLPDGPSATTL